MVRSEWGRVWREGASRAGSAQTSALLQPLRTDGRTPPPPSPLRTAAWLPGHCSTTKTLSSLQCLPRPHSDLAGEATLRPEPVEGVRVRNGRLTQLPSRRPRRGRRVAGRTPRGTPSGSRQRRRPAGTTRAHWCGGAGEGRRGPPPPTSAPHKAPRQDAWRRARGTVASATPIPGSAWPGQGSAAAEITPIPVRARSGLTRL